MSLAASTAFFLADPNWPTPVTTRLAPDAILAQTNITGVLSNITDDPDSNDANWMTGTGAVDMRVSFPTPAANLVPGRPQEFRVRVRPGT